MRIIAVEEHFLDPEIAAATAPALRELSPDFAAAFVETGDFPPPDLAQGLGERRLADMDASGIAMQVLSCPNAQLLPAESAVELARKVNDKAADATRRHPDRFAAFAAMPTRRGRRRVVAVRDRARFPGHADHGQDRRGVSRRPAL
jgi:predicted TIM-barrel fold metal-dependent hydrolase